MNEIETKLSAARTRLILDKPFLGALVLRLPMVAADPAWCKTSATDARTFYYNADFIEALTLEQTQFVLSHEALHCALGHFARRQHRDKQRWDIACDLAINPLLIAEQLEPCPGALHLVEFQEMTAEEIYPCLDESEQMRPHDDHLYDQSSESQGGTAEGRSAQSPGETEGFTSTQPPTPGSDTQRSPQAGSERPRPLSAGEQEQLASQWAQRLVGAHQQALQADKLGGALGRMIGHFLQPRVPWRTLLAQYLTANAREDYNWTRPSRREGDAILPSLHSKGIDVIIGLDSSGSISGEELQQFVSEIDALKGQSHARVTLLACDSELAAAGPWVFENWESLQLPNQLQGGGGTDFRPVFEWIERHRDHSDLLIYFTDALGSFPPSEPSIPVIWLVKGRAPVPWGQRIQLN